MGALIKVREYANPAEMMAHARELHRRTWHGNAAIAEARRVKQEAEAKAAIQARRDRMSAEQLEREIAEENAREATAFAQAEAQALYEATIGREVLARQPKSIIQTIAKQHGLTAEQLVSTDRTAPVVHARFAAIAAVKAAHPLMSLPSIGKHFGGRDHTTVLHALRRAEQLGAEALRTPWKPKPIRPLPGPSEASP